MQAKLIIAVMAVGIEAVARTMAAEAEYNNLEAGASTSGSKIRLWARCFCLPPYWLR